MQQNDLTPGSKQDKDILTIAHSAEPPQPPNGEPMFQKSIVTSLKRFIAKKYSLRLNLISRNIELLRVPIDDKILNSIFIDCKTTFNKATKDLVTSIIFSEFTQPYNPFAEFLDHYNQKPPKIKTGHIEALLDTIVTDTPNAKIFIKKWLVSLIASINYKHSPLLLVLCGGQNTGKTEWFRRLLPEALKKYYAESKLDLGKDDEILMTKKLIIMDDEMGGKSKIEQRRLKEMTSKQSFSIRAPYGRVAEELQRLALLCGTSNDEELLNDPTGNRRILPVRVLSIKIPEYNKINKDYLFYELWREYENGFDCNLSVEEIALLRDSTHDFKQSSTEEELVLKYFGLPEELGRTDIVEKTNSEILSYIKVNSQITVSQTKLGLVLKNMGFKQTSKKINGTTARLYQVIELQRSVANEVAKDAF